MRDAWLEEADSRKIALAKRGAKPEVANTKQWVPTGQTEVKNFPHLDLGIVPEIDT